MVLAGIYRPEVCVSRGVSEYLERFGAENVLVLFYDEIGSQVYWDSVCDFLGIERMPAGPARNKSNGDCALSDELRRRMKDLFRLDVEALEGIMGRDLSHWK